MPACAVETRHGRTQVIANYVPAMFASTSKRLTAVFLHTGWVYIDRHDAVVVSDVAVMDNGANDFHHGLVRVTRDGRWGLADTHGRLVVPFKYGGMLDYQRARGGKCAPGVVRRLTENTHGSRADSGAG